MLLVGLGWHCMSFYVNNGTDALRANKVLLVLPALTKLHLQTNRSGGNFQIGRPSRLEDSESGPPLNNLPLKLHASY